jgi:hypothetical protein
MHRAPTLSFCLLFGLQPLYYFFIFLEKNYKINLSYNASLTQEEGISAFLFVLLGCCSNFSRCLA